MHFIVPLMAC